MPPPPKPTRRQVNVRLPTDLVELIDTRRAKKDLSRDAWVERALRYALENNPAESGLRSGTTRTATPPHRRPVR